MLGDDLQRGKLDIAFLRRQQQADLEYKFVAKEPLVVILPSDHQLAERDAIDPHDLVGEPFIGISRVPCVLRVVIDDYLQRSGIEIVHILMGSIISQWPFPWLRRRGVWLCSRPPHRIS